MGARSRSKTTKVSWSGSVIVTYNGTPILTIPSTSYISGYDVMYDSTSPIPHPDQTLNLTKKLAHPVYISGDDKSGPMIATYNNHAPQFRAGYQYCTEPTSTPWDLFETKALANLNPNIPDFDFGLFLFEFKDLPRMLKQMGDFLGHGGPPKPGDANHLLLAWQLGWAPLFSDLNSLLNLVNILENRKRYLENLRKSGYRLKRTIHNSTETILLEYSSLSTYNSFSPTGKLCDYSNQVDRKRKAWIVANASVPPYPIGGFDPETNDRIQAARSALGAHHPASTVWNMIPWSWLIDYFVNIGSIIESSGGKIPLTLSRVNVMCTTTIVDTFIPHKYYAAVSVSTGKLITIRKERRPYSRPLMPSVFFKRSLSKGAFQVLASLVVAKALKRGFHGIR